MGTLWWSAVFCLASLATASTTYYLRLNISDTNDPNETAAVSEIVKHRITEQLPYSYYDSYSIDIITATYFSDNTIVILWLNCSEGVNFDLMRLSEIIYSEFVNSSSIVTVNGRDFVIQSIKVFGSFSDADGDTNALELKICRERRNICQPNQRCINTEYQPICQDICDYGKYIDGNHCVDCGPGKTTLFKGAITQSSCVDDCDSGYYFSLTTLTCTACPTDQYWDQEDRKCHVCPYNSFNATTCNTGESRDVSTRPVNIDMDLVLVTSTCTPLNFSNIMKEPQAAKSIIRSFIWSNYRFIYYKDLCFPDPYSCENVYAEIVNNEICVPDPLCTDVDNCQLFRTKFHAIVYYTWEFLEPVFNMTVTKYNQSSVEALMGMMYDLTNMFAMSGDMIKLKIRFELPFTPKVTVVDLNLFHCNVSFMLGVEHKPEYDTSSQERNLLMNIFWQAIYDKIPSFIPEFLTSVTLNMSSCQLNDTMTVMCINSTLWFKTKVDENILQKIAEFMVLSHEKVGGYLGQFHLIGPLALFKTDKDKESAISAISWCNVMNKLSVAQFFCEEGNRCINMNSDGSFACTQSIDCRNWTWGENCTEPCTCDYKNTETCDKYNGTCVCKPDFDGQICNAQINPCLQTPNPCGEHKECFFLNGSYECSSSSKCGNWTWGDNCNELCGCNHNNTEICSDNGTCICRPGFKGASCNEDVDECVEFNPCVQNADCINTEGGFSCQCLHNVIQNGQNSSGCQGMCSPGSYYSLETLECEPCPSEQYWSHEDQMCHVCPYYTYNSTSCTEGSGRNIRNPYVNIELDLTLITSSCQVFNFSAGLQSRGGASALLKGFIVGNYMYLYYNNLCFQCPYCCDNIQARVMNQEICIPDVSCADIEICNVFRTRLHAGVYLTRLYVEPVLNMKSVKHNQSSVDAFLGMLYNLTNIQAMSENFSLLNPRFELPFHPVVSTVDDASKRHLFINIMIRPVQLPGDDEQEKQRLKYEIDVLISSKFGEYIPEFVMAISDTIRPCERPDNTLMCLNYTIWFRKDMDELTVQKVAEVMALNHEKTLHSSVNYITGPLMLYRTREDMEAKISAINWCDVINRLSVDVLFCDHGSFCVNANLDGSFQCREKIECDNWTWGENCSELCDCDKNNTEICSKNGTCTCKSGFRGSLCDQVIDVCLENSPCGDNANCININGGYECHCSEGFKHSSLNYDICEVCLTWTWGADCYRTCECHKNSTDNCNVVTGDCLCKPGFKSTNCDMDIDECQQSANLCSENMKCVNTAGSYKCEQQDEKSQDQRELYPYGADVGDSVIQTSGGDNWYYWYDAISEPITFTGGVPFGSQKVKEAYVLPNGLMTFGKQKRVWYPNLDYTYLTIPTPSLLAPFWTYTNPKQTGRVYYHHYELSNSRSPQVTAVFTRANTEIMEHFKLKSYKATNVVSATWTDIEPYSWYMWLCEYFEQWKDYDWWQMYYQEYYDKYCKTNQTVETNTFQAIYISDGQTAYAIVTYKNGAMKWLYDEYRSIAVGFVSSDTLRDYGVSYTDLTTKMDSIVWNSGRYGTWIEKVGEIKNPDSQCLSFYLENKHLINNKSHQEQISALFDCPCSMDRLGAQWWWFSWTEDLYSDRSNIVCYAISPVAKSRVNRLNGININKLCCYNYTDPDDSDYSWESWQQAWMNSPYIPHRDSNAGHLLLNDPWWWWGDARKSKEEDFNPHRWCCQDSSSPSKFCNLFNEVRPDYGCSLEAEFISGRALGDPHILTADGLSYTFNGLGEYILFKISVPFFMLQGRTKQVVNSQGIKVNATVFVAFAAQEGNYSKFQVELDAHETDMVILANNQDVTQEFYKKEDYNEIFGNNDIGIQRQNRNNKTTVIATFPSGASIRIYVGLKNLEFSVDVPTSLKGQLKGLLGNFNGDPADDYILPDGTILSPNKTDSERKIFENFGQEWKVTTSDTVFTYPEGQTALDYQHADFVPVFNNELNGTDSDLIRRMCGNNFACIYDYLSTGDAQFASNSRLASEEASSVLSSQFNKLPILKLAPNQLNSQQQWDVTHGKTSTLQFLATDGDAEDTIIYELKGTPSSDITIDSYTGNLTYKPNIRFQVTIGVQAVDSKGGSSSIIYLDLVICPDCSGVGVCDKSRTQEDEKEMGRFVLFACECLPAFTGENCESEYNACLDRPCLENQKCKDRTAAEQGNSSIGYSCGPCPDGYEERNYNCVDKNECITNGTNPVCPEHSICKNSEGSFSCTCREGFRLEQTNTSRCRDIDECAERTHTCQQGCLNTEGGYTCSCLPGNKLNIDNETCQQEPSTTTLCKEKGCSQACSVSNGIASCSCNTGYTLSGDTHCLDINECTSGNKPCRQSCQNTEGGFLCSCYPGYKLDQDGVSCSICDQPYHGSNCSRTCVCNGHGTCNHVRGCECNIGWTGYNCNLDVDECLSDKACSSGQICANTLGSYQCQCATGYTKNNTCTDINECLDVLDNNCDLSVEDCVNNIGSYSCVCRIGYARDKNKICKDINECTTQTHNCDQICENTLGNFNCKCNYGYTLGTDRTSCVKRDIVCDLKCDHICTMGQGPNTSYCLCKSGYSLQGTSTCQDINECNFDHLNLCDKKDKCVNTGGSYNCSCLPGYFLDNNGRSCIACGHGKWGPECSNDCACGTGADSCEPVRGCLCKPGFAGAHCDRDVDECTTGLLICQAGEKCVNSFGSASCQCLKGYSKLDGKCQDINECSSYLTNDCDQVCDNFVGGFSCSCYTGYKYLNRTCTDIDECKLNLDGCEQNCDNTNGGYHCSCSDGLKLGVDGVSCVVTDVCVPNPCSDKCAVVNANPVCFCPKGKQFDAYNKSLCIDADMCLGNSCSDNCQETNNGSSFQCTCPNGKKLAADGITCIDCLSGTYGLNCSKKCSCNATNTDSCDKTTGDCICKPGWLSATCDVDNDECQVISTCPSPFKCVNVPGSFVCKCNTGYYSSNSQCLACSDNTFGEECKNQCQCDLSHSSCDKVTGYCTCYTGWTGIHCDKDINECNSTDNICVTDIKDHWMCMNSPGSYKCDCASGYKNNDNTCVDLDECAGDFSNECDGNCSNTEGSYTCVCGPGYKLALDGHTCQDIDECQLGISSCHQKCTNDIGSFSCSCGAGYERDETNLKNCYKSIGYGFQIKLIMDVTGKNLREKLGQDYITLKGVIEAALKTRIRVKVTGLKQLLINSMRPGSVIVDLTTSIEQINDVNAASKMVEAILQIAETGLVVDGTLEDAIVTVGNITVPPTKDKCLILEALEPCGSDESCQLNGDGEAYCKSNNEELNIPLIVGLSVGIPLLVGLIVAVVSCIIYKKKYQTQRRINVREGNYVEHPGTPDGNFKPSTAPASTTITLGLSDKEKLFP